MEEIWKPVVGYEKYYEVSNLGRIKRKERTLKDKRGLVKLEEMFLKIDSNSNRNDYVQIGINTENKIKNVNLHRLVATTFIPNPENKPEVNHIDLDKKNNKVSNLEWVSRKENMQHYQVNKGN